VNLATEEESLTAGTGDQDTLFYKTLFVRETVNNLLNGKWGSLQVGADATLDQAGGSTLSSGVKQINEFGFFTSAEFLFGRLKARPGVRFTRNSAFETTPTPSINFSYQLSPNAQVRWSYGRGYRAPSVRELYHEFIDTNHNILGNPNLKPEYSHSLNADVAKEFDKSGWSVTLGAFFNQIENRITYFIPLEANQPTSYINQSLYKTTGTSIGTSYSSGQVTIKTGLSYVGQYQQLTESERIPTFLFSPEINNQIQYSIGKTGVKVFTFYKFTGPNRQYSLDSNDEVILNRSNGFHMLDLTITKTFFENIVVGAGAKNLLNVTTVNSNTTGSAHSGSSNSVSYGRSFFIRLNYHFKQ
jgi:outer membrane receptor for ferrienterochelin and colicins